MRAHHLNHELRLKKEICDAKKAFLSSKIRRALADAASCKELEVQSSTCKDYDENDSNVSGPSPDEVSTTTVSCSSNSTDEPDSESLQSCETAIVITTDIVPVSAKSAEKNPTAASHDTSKMESKSEPAIREVLVDKPETSASSPDKQPTAGTSNEASDSKSESEPAECKSLNDIDSNSASSSEEEQSEVNSGDTSESDSEPDKKKDPTEVMSVDTSDLDSESEKTQRVTCRSKRRPRRIKRSYERRIQSSDVKKLSETDFIYMNKYPFTKTDVGYKCGICSAICTLHKGSSSNSYNMLRHIHEWHINNHRVRATKVRQHFIEIAPNRFQYGKHNVELIDEKYRCEECGKVRAGRTRIMEHIRNHHESPSRSFVCEFCGQVYRTPSSLSKHKKVLHTTNTNRFLTDKFIFTFDNKWLPKNITLPKFSLMVKQISPTDFLFMDKYSFQGTEFGFKCGLCRVVSSFTVFERSAPWENVVKHIKKWHMGDQDMSKLKSTTQRCIQVGPDRFQYGKISFAKVDGMFQCGECGVLKIPTKSNIDTMKNIRHHIAVHHHKIKSREHICEHCGLVYNAWSTLRLHKLTKHENRNDQFPCNECGKKFASRSSVVSHQKRVHLHRRDFICESCGRGFYDKHSLEVHVASVHKKEKLKCEECGKIFGSQAALKVHQFSHNGKKYSCDICGMDFTQHYSVTRHKKTAHNE